MEFSVLMSVYYKENPEYLKRALDSILNQTITADEIVLIKDGPLTKELRYIDWEHGNPYVFKSSDFNNLIKSKALFARKFNVENIDVVKKITQHILNEL